jgi:hypothetical protein
MADNVAITPGTGATVAADDIGGVLHQRVKLSIGADGSATDLSEAAPLPISGKAALVSGNFTRPADTTAYAIGDLVANNTTAGSVTPISLTIGRGASGNAATGMIRRARLRKSGTSITAAQFRLHLYRASPTVSNGDNGAWLTGSVGDYVGHIDFTCDKVFTNGASGNGIPALGSEINFASQTYYGLIEARAAYTPGNAEVFTVELEVIQN